MSFFFFFCIFVFLRFFCIFFLGLFLFGFVLTETFFLDESSAGLITCSQGDGLWAIPIPEKIQAGDRGLRTKIFWDIKLKKEHVEIPGFN